VICLVAILILLGIILLVVGFLFLPARFGVRYEKTAQKNKIYAYVSVFGILIRFPLHNKKDSKEANKKTRAVSKKRNSGSAFSFEQFQRKIDVLGEVCEVSKDELSSMLSFVKRHLRCHEIDFRIVFGFDDAAKTGITTGAVWTSGTLLLKIIDNFIGIEKINMNVYPDFNQKKFEIYVKTILIMRPIHFIIIVDKVRNTIKFIKNKINNM